MRSETPNDSAFVRAGRWVDTALSRIANVLAILAALGVASAGSGAVLGVSPLLLAGIAVAGPALALVAIRSALSAVRRHRRRRRQHSYSILSKDLVYQYAPGAASMVQTKRFRIRANHDGVQQFEDRYRWSGSGHAEIRLLTPGQDRGGRLDGPRTAGQHRDVQEDMWCRYEVEWTPSLKKGDELDIEVRWDLDNSVGDARDFYSTTVDVPTKALSMEVRLPPDLAADWILKLTYEYFTATEPVEEELERPGNATTLTWRIGKPRLGHRYVIRWGRD
ncbi:MAG: hypothetical protein QOE65_1398 [Solirubrobacteraceae bacterium]|jgi:hypothetical protein|nr:hypothetical protein [Solirubrobacteraceae bacterium]